MRRSIFGILAMMPGLALSMPAHASGQSTVLVGAAATIPTQDFGEVANAGWMGFAGLLFPIGETAFSVGAEGYYGQNGHEVEGNRTDLYGAMALGSVSMGAADAPVRPFVLGGLGSMTHSFTFEDFPDLDASETNLAATVGAGISFALGSLGGSVVASATTGMFELNSTTLAAIGAAVQIPFGG